VSIRLTGHCGEFPARSANCLWLNRSFYLAWFVLSGANRFGGPDTSIYRHDSDWLPIRIPTIYIRGGNMTSAVRRSLCAVAMFFTLGSSALLAAPTAITGTYETFGDAAPPGVGPGPWVLTSTPSTFSGVFLAPDQSFTFAQLTSLSATFTSVSGGSGGGSPRLFVEIDTDNNPSTFNGAVQILLGNSPSFTDSDATLNGYSGFNLIGNNDPGRYDLSQLGGSATTNYAAALALVGNIGVQGFDFVTDTFRPFPDRVLTLSSINAVADIPGPSVPEPTSVALLGLAFGALAFNRRRRKSS
jgi:hypothetical protein